MSTDAIELSPAVALQQRRARLRIAINGRFLLRRQTGVDRFAGELCAALDQLLDAGDEMLDGVSLRLLLPHGEEPARDFAHIPMQRIGIGSGHLWEQFALARALAPGELLASLCNTSPLAVTKQLVVIHDAATAAVPEAFSLAFRALYRSMMPLLGRRARRVLTVSQFSHQELVSRFAIPEDRLSVVSEGGEHILRANADPSVLARHGLGRRPFVLAVSSMASHKNFGQVLAALQALGGDAGFDVAIAGGANPRVFGEFAMQAGGQVHWLGYVSDGELRALYQSAMCFVFPSKYEGFGIPPLEAMHCGCPVLAARAASIPEVCGDAALYFDPFSVADLSSALQRIAVDEPLRARLKAAGLQRCRAFSWESGARQLLAECRRAGAAL